MHAQTGLSAPPQGYPGPLPTGPAGADRPACWPPLPARRAPAYITTYLPASRVPADLAGCLQLQREPVGNIYGCCGLCSVVGCK